MAERGTDVTNFKRAYRTPQPGDFPDSLTITFGKANDLRYGENPHQPAAEYNHNWGGLAAATNIRLAKSGKGGLSATNLMDVSRALNILKFFPKPSVAVMKHLIPSGFATQHEGNSLMTLYELARDADARSAFGSVVVSNVPIDRATAEALLTTFVEGVAAPDFEEGVMPLLEEKKDLRAILFSNLDRLPRFAADAKGHYDFKALPTGQIIVQHAYLSSIQGHQDLVLDPMIRREGEAGEIKYVVARDPTQQELEDMLTAWYVNIGVRSNGIVLVKNGVTVAIGSGQQERVGAVEQAIVKAYQKAMDREKIRYDPLEGARGRELLSANPLEGAVASSDAFFPYRDSIDLLARVGVTAVIQPGGSVKDYQVIQAVNEYGMAMAFTLERCFSHF